MGKIVVLITLVLLLALSGPANAELAITEIMCLSVHHGTSNDWWELTNTGPSSVDLTGYSWDNSFLSGPPVPGTNVFGNITITAGESIIILEDDAHTDDWINDWGLGTWVNVYDVTYFAGNFSSIGAPDEVALFDAGGFLVTSVEYPIFTGGFSNEWATDGMFLGLSVIGENGAYQSLNSGPDVGSPGYAVPEPATVILLSLGGLALLRKRRT